MQPHLGIGFFYGDMMAGLTAETAIELMTIIDDAFDVYELSGMERLGILASMQYNILRTAEIQQDEED